VISLFGSNVGKEEIDAMAECVHSQWLGIGAKNTQFESMLAEKSGAGSVFVNSGSNALQLALKLLDLPEGSEVILPSFTWIACANAVMLNRLKPIFCDVDLHTFNMRPEDVQAKITSKTSAIMVVHYAGKPVDMDAMKAFGLPIVEDAAHSIDSFYKGKHCGAIGDVGIFSFDAVKNITTGEGGALISKDPAKIERAKKLRYCGIGKSGFQASATKARWWEYEIFDSFPKMLNTDMAAAMGIEQLKKLPDFQARRRALWATYEKNLSESWASGWLETPAGEGKEERHSFFTYCLKLKAGNRDQLAKFLYDKGVYTSLRFHPLHMNSIYKSGEKLKNCETLNEIALNIPFHHRLSDGDVDQVFSALKEYRAKHI
jgi:dTDP-4-amino-4,6-dideoxygalactose transaminase